MRVVGEQDGPAQARRALGQRRLARRAEVARLERLGDGVDAELAGDLAGGVAPHAVGDDEEVVVLEDRVGVLVVLALEARDRCGPRRSRG